MADSFGDLDLDRHGFELLFEAAWFHGPAVDGPPGPLPEGWSVVSTAPDLAAWSEAHDYTGVLAPAVLDNPRFRILARHRDGALVGGAVTHRGTDVVDLSNVWGDDDPSLYDEVLAAVQALHPGRAVTGYADGAELEEMLTLRLHRDRPAAGLDPLTAESAQIAPPRAPSRRRLPRRGHPLGADPRRGHPLGALCRQTAPTRRPWEGKRRRLGVPGRANGADSASLGGQTAPTRGQTKIELGWKVGRRSTSSTAEGRTNSKPAVVTTAHAVGGSSWPSTPTDVARRRRAAPPRTRVRRREVEGVAVGLQPGCRANAIGRPRPDAAHAADAAERALGHPRLSSAARTARAARVGVPVVGAAGERHRHAELGVAGQLGEGPRGGVHQSWLRSRGLRDQPPSSVRRGWRSRVGPAASVASTARPPCPDAAAAPGRRWTSCGWAARAS